MESSSGKGAFEYALRLRGGQKTAALTKFVSDRFSKLSKNFRLGSSKFRPSDLALETSKTVNSFCCSESIAMWQGRHHRILTGGRNRTGDNGRAKYCPIGCLQTLPIHFRKITSGTLSWIHAHNGAKIQDRYVFPSVSTEHRSNVAPDFNGMQCLEAGGGGASNFYLI